MNRDLKRAAALTAAVVGAGLAPAVAGASTFNDSSVAVSSSGGDYVYSGFDGAGFSVFSRDPNSGLLTQTSDAPGTPGGGGLIAPAIAPSIDQMNVYGVDGASNTLFEYSGAGGLVLRNSYPVLASSAVAEDPTDVAITPDGADVDVLTYGVGLGTGIGIQSQGKISSYVRNATSGDLTLAGTTTLDPTEPGAVGEDLVISPNSAFVYVAGGNGISVLKRNASTGALSYVGTDGSTNGALGVAISPDGSDVYEAGPSSSSSSEMIIETLSANAGTGTLTPQQAVDTGTAGATQSSMHLSVSPDGNCVYETDKLNNQLNWFSRAGNGDLTYEGTYSEGQLGINGLSDPGQVTTAGTDVYVASAGDNGIGVFRRVSATSCAPSFAQLAQDLFNLSTPTVNAGAGTATLPVQFAAAGSASVTVVPAPSAVVKPSATGPRRRGRSVRNFTIGAAETLKVPVSVTGTAATRLLFDGQLPVNATVTFTATGGSATTKQTTITLTQSPGFVPPTVTRSSTSLGARLSAGQWVRRLSVTLPAGVSFRRPAGSDLSLRSKTGRAAFRLSTPSAHQAVLMPRRHLGAVLLTLPLGGLASRRHGSVTARVTLTTSTGAQETETVTLKL